MILAFFAYMFAGSLNCLEEISQKHERVSDIKEVLSKIR